MKREDLLKDPLGGSTWTMILGINQRDIEKSTNNTYYFALIMVFIMIALGIYQTFF